MSFAFGLVQDTSLSSSLVRSDFLNSSSAPSTPRRKSLPPRNTPRSARFSKHSSLASSSRESLPSLSSSTSSLSSLSSSSSRPKNRRQNTPPALKHALSIFQHVYFSRKWTFQEIILAKAAIICCGDLEMAWSDLSLWYFHYASKLRHSSLLYDSDGSFENILKVRNEIDKGTLTLSHLLMLTRPRLSTKPEDAVYALLGLVPDLVPSLHQTYAETDNSQDESLFRLYLLVFQHCIEKERDLAILSAAGRYKGNVQAENWPGWLPDWRQKLPLRPLVLNAATDLGPESAFDEDEDRPLSPVPRPVGDQQPLYKMHFDPAMLPLSSRRFSMTVSGVRLGCIVTRPLAWPATFLVLDPSTCPDPKRADIANGDQYSQALSSLASSFKPLLQRPLTRNSHSIADDYSANLIRSALKVEVRCSSVRSSAMVETGDWLCAFRGGKTLFAVRPTAEQAVPEPTHIGQRFRKAMRSNAKSTESAVHQSTALKCLYIGECGVHGLDSVEALAIRNTLIEFELG
jgi:hypothetical protein